MSQAKFELFQGEPRYTDGSRMVVDTEPDPRGLERVGGNFPPSGFEVEPLDPEIVAAIDKEIAAVDSTWAAITTIETEELAAECVDARRRLDDLWTQYEERRKAEKKPFDDRVAAVQAKWSPVLEKIGVCRNVLYRLERAWLRLKTERVEEARRAADLAAAEKRRRAEQLAEQAKGTGPGAASNQIAAKQAQAEAEEAAAAASRIPERARTRGVLSGVTRSLTTYWRVRVMDQEALYKHFRQHPDVKDLLERLANAAVRAKDGPRPPPGETEGFNPALPGCWLISEQR